MGSDLLWSFYSSITLVASIGIKFSPGQGDKQAEMATDTAVFHYKERTTTTAADNTALPHSHPVDNLPYPA